MPANPHALVTRELVAALLRLERGRQRAMMGAAVAYLARETKTEVRSLYDFVMGAGSAEVPAERREQLLGVIARAVREDDEAALTIS